MAYNARDRMYWTAFHPVIALWYTSLTQKWSAESDQHKCEEMFEPGKYFKITLITSDIILVYQWPSVSNKTTVLFCVCATVATAKAGF